MNLVRLKRSATIRGVMLSELTVGHGAVIFHQGRIIRTQPVVAVHGISDEEIRFETEDTDYTLLGGPRPQAAFARYQPSMAA